jgi:hypothetical protein
MYCTRVAHTRACISPKARVAAVAWVPVCSASLAPRRAVLQAGVAAGERERSVVDKQATEHAVLHTWHVNKIPWPS